MNKPEVINTIYDALNRYDASGISQYLADDVQIIPLWREMDPIVGIQAVTDSLQKMLSISEESHIVFKSGPHVMGDVIVVEYIHNYKLNGVSKQDHNVSLFVFVGDKIKKWVGYIHPK